jgi:hypothetical protein
VDVAQLVERDLAKVEAAGSRPVVRSKRWWRNQVDAHASGACVFGREGSIPSRRTGWH